MKAAIVLPIPLDAWQTFWPFIRLFTDSFRNFQPGYDRYKLIAVVNGGRICDDIASMFYGINTQFIQYDEGGCDIGSLQHAVKTIEGDYLAIGMTSRCYLHREGWLSRYMEARSKHGPGLYGASASFESGTPHICTRAYALDASLLRQYPHLIDTRAKGQKFETGELCLTTWVRNQGLPTMQVTWDGEQDQAHWRDPSETQIYRRGNQSAMLVWDKHSDAFRDADSTEKLRLEAMANPKT